jgi:hypothetical protein
VVGGPYQWNWLSVLSDGSLGVNGEESLSFTAAGCILVQQLQLF